MKEKRPTEDFSCPEATAFHKYWLHLQE